MKRSVRPALIATLLAALVVSGCGIPDDSAVVPVGLGPSRGATSGDEHAPVKSLRTDTTDKVAFVENFLTAAAGDYDSAIDEVKKFMSPEAAATFKPSPGIKVVHLEERPLINPDDPNAKLQVRQVGSLDEDGVLTPAGSSDTNRYEITIGAADGQTGLFVTKMTPPALLITDTALSTFYARRTIYFWNTDHTGLVPDLRYMSQTVPKEQQPTVVLSWLVKGPAEWLGSVAEGLPSGTKPNGVVPAVTKDTLQINLSSQALAPDYATKDPGALTRLQQQLRWSLRPDLPTAMELNVEHVIEPVTYSDDEYLRSNALYRRPAEPERFVVYDGQIRRLARSPRASEPVPVITPAVNRNVQAAAFGASDGRTYAALVVKDPTTTRSELRVGSAAPGKQDALRKISLAAPIGHPVWAVSPQVGAADTTFGLVTAKGKLYSFSPSGSIHLVGGVGDVAAVAVAPDARRVALISGGRLYLAALSDEDGMQLSTPILIRTEMTNLTAVDWSGEEMLVVSGRRPDNNNRVAIQDVSIDGASQTNRLSDLGSNPLSYLTAYPARPSSSGETEVPVAYELSGFAYDESSFDSIGIRDLALPVTNPRPGVQVTAPFFLN